ncbi:MAG: LysR family transcriptional regulator [Oscillospiraceae bacterium]|nr:LysR family transcriptional regulator [Oscillospiraceae bacterium]
MTDQMVKSFLDVCRTKSVTKAAEMNGLTQQAVSKQIAQMELDLGSTLFFRENRSMIMTPDGYKYFNFFLTAFNEFDEIRSDIQESQNESEKILRVSYLERLLIPPAFQQGVQILRSHNKKFSIRCMILDESEVEDALFNGKCDLFVGYDIFHHSDHKKTVKIKKLQIARAS